MEVNVFLISRYLQNRTRVVVWLYENVNTRIEGQIVGFDGCSTSRVRLKMVDLVGKVRI